MKALAKDYCRQVDKTLRTVCSIQGIIAVVFAIGYYYLGLKLAPRLGLFAVLLATLSLPSLAVVGVWRLNHYNRVGWKKNNARFDFDGRWALKCTFIRSAASKGPSLPAPQVGHMMIAQSSIQIDLDECTYLDEATDKEVSTLKWLSCAISEAGDIHATYEVDEIIDGGVIRGYERIWVVRREPNGRPIRMKSIWYDCVRDSGSGGTYVGESEYWRPTDQTI